MSAQLQVPRVFTLTDLTGRRGEDADTEFIGVQEVRKKAIWSLVAAAVVALIVAAPLAPILGMYSLGVGILAGAVLYFLIEYRQSSGLQLRAYQVLLDKKRSQDYTFLLGGKPYDPLAVDVFDIIPGSVPVATTDERRVKVAAAASKKKASRRTDVDHVELLRSTLN